MNDTDLRKNISNDSPFAAAEPSVLVRLLGSIEGACQLMATTPERRKAFAAERAEREHWLALLSHPDERTRLEALIYVTEVADGNQPPLPESCGGAPGVRLPEGLDI